MARPLLLHPRTRVDSYELPALLETVPERRSVHLVVGSRPLCARGCRSACLPDLRDLPVVVPSEAAAPISGCGDGIIATNDDGSDAGESCDPGGNTVIGCPRAAPSRAAASSDRRVTVTSSPTPATTRAPLTNRQRGGRSCRHDREAKTRPGSGSLVGSGTYRIGLLLDDNLSLVAYKTPPVRRGIRLAAHADVLRLLRERRR